MSSDDSIIAIHHPKADGFTRPDGGYGSAGPTDLGRLARAAESQAAALEAAAEPEGGGCGAGCGEYRPDGVCPDDAPWNNPQREAEAG